MRMIFFSFAALYIGVHVLFKESKAILKSTDLGMKTNEISGAALFAYLHVYNKANT